jgi:hypothetical protein
MRFLKLSFGKYKGKVPRAETGSHEPHSRDEAYIGTVALDVPGLI